MRATITKSQQATNKRKYFLLAILLSFLTLPHASQGFGFGFGGGGGGGDDDGDAASRSADAGDGSSMRSMMKRRPVVTERKFKFRKIERVYVDEANDEDDEDITSQQLRESMRDYGDDGDNGRKSNGDDDDDDAVAAADERRADRRDADSSRRNENEEFQFERARKAHKDSRGSRDGRAAKKSPGSGGGGKFRDDSAETVDESKSFLGSLIGGLFGGQRQAKSEGTSEEKSSNSIIDWLMWLGEKTGRLTPETPATAQKKKPSPSPPLSAAVAADSSGESFLSYFNRWPFNSLFNIGKPEKPIRVPRRSPISPSQQQQQHQSQQPSRDDSIGNGEIDSTETPTFHRDNFETLIHSLPGFVVNADDVSDTECRQQMQIFNRQLRGHKLWTLQMLDATGKITSGLLRGNINQFGDFDLCTQVRTLVKVTPDITMRIRGKYCLAHIEAQTAVPELKVPLHLAHGRGLWNSHLGNPSHFVPRYAVANWGVCVPHSCSGRVVQQMLETNLGPYNTTGVEFHVEVDDENDCYMRHSKKFTKLLAKDNKFAWMIGAICLLLLLLWASLCQEHWSSMKEFVQSKMTTRKSEDDNAKESAGEGDEGEENKTSETEAKEEESRESPAEEDSGPVPAAESAPEATDGSSNEVERQELFASLKVALNEILASFSPRRTLSDLLSTDRYEEEFPILHLLKLGATFMLYVCLKFLMIGHLPITNRDKLVRSIDQPISILFRSPIIYMDVLLLISGFLSAYQLSDEIRQRSTINALKRLAAKVARYLPSLYVVLGFQTWILPHLGSGPLWTNLVGQNSRICEQQMWRNLFGVQNAIDFEETCSPMTIQLALELQLYLLGPLIVWLYHTDADAGFFVYGAVHAMSVAARYARTNREHLSMTLFHGMNVSKFYRTANILFSSPIARATPYLIGIGAGLLYRSEGGCLDIAPELLPIGWLLSGLGLLWCFWSPSAGMRSDYIYTSGEAASFAAWSPLILGLALSWLIFMFPRGDDSIVRHLTSSRPIIVLSRIAYPVQLAMYVVVMYNTARVKDSNKYHVTDMIDFSEIGTILIFGLLLAFIIDGPSQRLRHLLVNRLFSERSKESNEAGEEQEPISGAEGSEGEPSEDHSDPLASETVEATDSVWDNESESAVKENGHKHEEKVEVEEEIEEVVEEEEEEEEEIEEIAEADEVKKRPEPEPEPEPPAAPPEKAETKSYTRRRLQIAQEEEENEPKPSIGRRRRSSSTQEPEEKEQAKEELPRSTYTRRRRPLSDD